MNLRPARLLLFPAFALVLSGCRTPMERLDQQAAALIEQRQALAFGDSASQDPQTVPLDDTPPTVTGDLYDQTPPTNNPALDALPAETDQDTAVDTDSLPITVVDVGEPVRLDLEGILGYAVRHAPDYRREKEELFLTTLSLIIERHEWGPRFFSGVRGQLDGTPESGDFDTAGSLLADLGVTQRLPYGGSISAAALVEYVAFLNKASTNTADDDSQSAAVNLAINLPLLRGAGMVAREDLIQAERNLIYAARDFERFRREFLVDLASEYFDLVFAQQQIRNQELQLSNLAFVGGQFRALADAGKIRGFQAENLEQDVLSARNRLLNLREGYANQLDSFKITLGMPTEAPLEIEPVNVSVPAPLLYTDEAVTTALALRLDLQTDADGVIDSRRAVKNARNGLLPDLDIDADLNLRTDPDERNGGFDLDPSESDYSAGFNFELPLDRKIEYSQLRGAQVRYERSRREHRVFRDRVALEVRRTIRDIEQARFTLELQKRNVLLNERRALEVSIRRRSVGAREVIEAQEDLVNARNARDRAAADLRIAVLNFLLATGQMRVGPTGQWESPTNLTPLENDPADMTFEAAPDDLSDVELLPDVAAPVLDAGE